MNDRDFYKSTFSQVHTTTSINMEDYKKMKLKQKHNFKIVAAVASICMILVASTTVYAMNMFGLKDMIVGKANIPSTSNMDSQITPDNIASTENVTVTPSVTPVDLISLQGFADSNENKAVAEWSNFYENYDQDGAIIAQIGNGPTGLDPKYNLYSVYTQEMADKLSEIVEKYNLSLHSEIIDIYSADELLLKTGSGNFLGTINTVYSGYMYEDGTFHYDGYANLDNGLTIDYQFTNTKKGAFNDVVLNIGSIDDYVEWSYTTTCGITVRLAIGPMKALIITDLGDSFLTINVLVGTVSGLFDESGKITATDLEAFSNSFDYSLIN